MADPAVPAKRIESKGVRDTQIIEIRGRHRLVDEILQPGLEVALPIRDRGIDLIVYADLSEHVQIFVARPIQMKASSERSFGLYRKYARFPDLIIAYLWHLAAFQPSRYVCAHLFRSTSHRRGDRLDCNVVMDRRWRLFHTGSECQSD